MERLSKKIYNGYKQYPVKVLQFGEGNFLRAFIDWQIDMMNKKADFNGSVAVVQPIANGLVEKLNEQDGLFTLYLQGIRNGKPVREHMIINSINVGIDPYKQYDEYLRLAENPELRFIISNTTEAGIVYEEGVSRDEKPPKTYPAKLTVFLYHRYKYFKGQSDKGFVIIPCELIDRNGGKLKSAVLSYAAKWGLGDGFISWLNESNTFCCSLVDRIVSGYPAQDIDKITAELGYEDALVDIGEQFHLWIIEGPEWIANELPVKKAGLNVKFVSNMSPYRTRKVRILNGAHTTMMPVAYLYGIDTVGKAVKHDVVGKFIRGAVYDEIIPTLGLPAEETREFADEVMERFENPYVNHCLMSIALNSMSKFETRVLPSLLEYKKRKGILPKKLVFSLAALIEFYKGDRNGEKIKLNDEQEVLTFFKGLWGGYDGGGNSLKEIVNPVLGYKKVFKTDLNKVDGLADAVLGYLTDIEASGMKKAIEKVL